MRILNDAEVTRLVDRKSAVDRMTEGYRADARGEVYPLPRRRTEAHDVTVAWMGAAIPSADILGFRTYLYDRKGADRGDQVVALYRYSTMELKALFLGRTVGTLRTGAAIAAAVGFASPNVDSLGLIGTGAQARHALACAATIRRWRSVSAWSPNPERRATFARWGEETLGLPVRAVGGADEVLAEAAAVVLTTSADSPVVTPKMLPGPRLLVSLSAYRRPEIDPRLLDAASHVWTDSVEQASGPGTFFQAGTMRDKLRKLADADSLADLRDPASTRIVINTGAAWEEVVLAESLWQSAERSDAGWSTTLPREP
ncbi:MAG TPA: hypothetical protein VML94_07210 [Thermoplasmata archaeon]|nr:hypothetical protein [Thermoplasmata archaeon]